MAPNLRVGVNPGVNSEILKNTNNKSAQFTTFDLHEGYYQH